MDLILDKPFIIKANRIKDVVSNINFHIENELKKTKYYEEDKEYFHFETLYLTISSKVKSNKIIFKNLDLFYPKLVILKSYKNINDYYLKKNEWLIVPFDIRESYFSEGIIYGFSLV